jgi:RNA polymerase sigma factor (TIGR02999 family)
MSENRPAPQEITQRLRLAAVGDRDALDDVFGLVYDELKAVARSRLGAERDGHTLSATALVHEAYFRLSAQNRVEWQSRSHFLAVAAQAMRRILIDHAKSRNAVRHGGKRPHVALEALADWPTQALTDTQIEELIALDDALLELEAFDPRAADIVQSRFFGGLSNGEIAEVLGVAEITVRRSWVLAKAWLRSRLGDGAGQSIDSVLGSGVP